MGDELFPRKDGQIVTSDIDYVDVWRVRTLSSGNTKTQQQHIKNFLLFF